MSNAINPLSVVEFSNVEQQPILTPFQKKICKIVWRIFILLSIDALLAIGIIALTVSPILSLGLAIAALAIGSIALMILGLYSLAKLLNKAKEEYPLTTESQQYQFTPIMGSHAYLPTNHVFNQPHLVVFISKASNSQYYEICKAKLQQWPQIKVSFDDDKQAIGFYHYPYEILAFAKHLDILQFIPFSLKNKELDLRNIKTGQEFYLDGPLFAGMKKRSQEYATKAIEFLNTDVQPIKIALETNLTENQLFEALCKKYGGFCIGESHEDLASKDWIEKNAQHITTVYMEGINYDTIQPWLDEYFTSPPGSVMPIPLKEALLASFKYLPKRSVMLVQSLKEMGVRVVGIDCTLSQEFSRIEAMNYTAVQVIQLEQERQKLLKGQAGSFVALMGMLHCVSHSIKGVADMLQCPSVIIIGGKETSIHYNVNNLKPAKVLVPHTGVFLIKKNS